MVWSLEIPSMGHTTCIKTLFLALISLVILKTAMGDPRTSVAGLTCNKTLAASGAILADNFVPAMDNLSSHVNANGYGTSVTGINPNSVYALAQCYGDLNPIDCKLCFSEIRSQLPKCYPNTGGILFLDGCFGRYENYSFFNEIFSQYDTTVCSFNKNSSNPSLFDQTVKEVVGNVSLQAQNNQGFAVFSASNSNLTVYSLAQCWKNLSNSLCSSCLHAAASAIVSCSPATEGRALYTGCFMRYSTSLFWNVNATSSSSSSTSKTIWIVVGLVLGGILIIVLGIFIAKQRGLWGRKKSPSLRDLYGPEIAAVISQSNLNFKYEDLKKATNNFSLSNKLGQGSYGTVYKGVLSDQKEIAVKQLFLNTRQWIEQFFNEVDLVNQVRHKNLVRLLGCSLDGSESLLVYEYYNNKSLDLFIFDESHDKLLDWPQRFDIIVGVAEGLSYLHEESDIRIIHRDIKASNILLDDKFKPKITDFGLARSFAQDQTHLTTGIAGTLGYLAPEYIVHGQLTEKADVYSYGIVVLEIVTGKRCSSPVGPHAEHSLLAKVWNHYKNNALDNVIDKKIYNKNVRDEIIQVVLVGLQCTQADPQSRPTMTRVVEMLRSNGRNEELVLSDPPFLDISPMDYLEQAEPLRSPALSRKSTKRHGRERGKKKKKPREVNPQNMQSAALSVSSSTLLHFRRISPKPNAICRLPSSFTAMKSPAVPMRGVGAAAGLCSVSLRLGGWDPAPSRSPSPRMDLAVKASSVPESAEGSAHKDSALAQTLLLGSLFGLWYLFNIYFNIYNKQVLKVFTYPLTITTCQFLIGTVLILFMWMTNIYSRPRVTASQLAAILPLAIVHTLGNLFTNMSLGKVAVSFTHTIKAMEPFFSVLLSALFLGEKPTVWVLFSLVPIVGGVALASMTEASFNWAGFWSAMASNVTFQSRNVLSKKVMVKKEESLDNINLFSIITIMSLLLLTPVTLLTEGVKFTPLYLQSAGLNLKQIYLRSLIAGLCFHAYQQVSYMILSRVSPVTHSVGNCVKRVVVIVTSVLFFRTPVSPINSIGTGIALAGVFLYSRVKRIKPKTA